MLTYPVTGQAGYNAAGLQWVPGRVVEIRRSEHPDRGRLPSLTEKCCYRTPIKPPIIGTLTVHIIATDSQGRRQPR